MIVIYSKEHFLREALLQQKELKDFKIIQVHSLDALPSNILLLIVNKEVCYHGNQIILGIDVVMPITLDFLTQKILKIISVFTLNNINFDLYNYIISNHIGEKIILTVKERDLLWYFYIKWPHNITKEQILNQVWQYNNSINTTTIEAHIYRIRQKIQQLAKNDYEYIIVDDQSYSLNFNIKA